MDPEVKTKWIAALRSGEYEQGRGLLAQRDEDGVNRFCCLGVLCDLAVREGLEVEMEYAAKDITKGGDLSVWSRFYDGCSTYLPASVMDWAELWTDDPVVPAKKGWIERPLSHLNDQGNSFAEIADMIEENL